MAPLPKPFISLVPSSAHRPRAAFFGKAGLRTIVRDSCSLETWLCIGAAIQCLLVIVLGPRLASIPALTLLAYRAITTYAITVGWVRNPYMNDITLKKTSAQFPDDEGTFQHGEPSNQDIVVLLIGTRVNHPLGLLAPGAQGMGQYFPRMAEDLEKHGEEYGYLGMTSWLNRGTRESKNEFMDVAYFRTVQGLHAFAHSQYHTEGWKWWNAHTEQYPHLSIFHEVYHVPVGHWENIYINSHPSAFASTTHKICGQRDR